ncbi:unnamed protein product [Urochloa humidicola]
MWEVEAQMLGLPSSMMGVKSIRIRFILLCKLMFQHSTESMWVVALRELHLAMQVACSDFQHPFFVVRSSSSYREHRG